MPALRVRGIHAQFAATNTTAPCFRPSSTLLDLPVCVATAPSIQFRKPGYTPHRNWLLLTDLLTNRIAQINTNHHKHTQPTVWNGHAPAFIIQFSRFRICPAEAVAVRRSGLFLGAAILEGIFPGPVLMSLANSLLTAGLTATFGASTPSRPATAEAWKPGSTWE